MGENARGNLEEGEFQTQLDKEAGKDKTEATDTGEEFEVLFKESKRYYTVDKDGNVGESQEIVEEKNAGDITKGGSLDGSEEKPFKINCIEDLVAFSIMTNGGNTELGLSYNNFEGKNVELERSLNFKSSLSYNDCTTTKYGDLNEDGNIEDIRTELTKTDENCKGFTPIGPDNRAGNRFKGNFNRKQLCDKKYIY